MKGIILYKGKYGSTYQYAQWLGKELRLDVREPEDVTEKELNDYDFLVIGSSVYMGKLLIRSWLKRHFSILHNKKLFLFIVGGTPVSEKEKLDLIINDNIPFSILNKATVQYFQGKVIMNELSWTDKFMLKMGARLEKDPETKRRMLTDFNAVKKENIEGLLNIINAYLSNTGMVLGLNRKISDLIILK